jgi:ribosome-associated protein
MSESNLIPIRPGVAIPQSELSFQASRSGGPGGQHVNTSSTRVELWWDAARSPSLSERQRTLLFERLASRLTADGLLRLVAGSTRSQSQNREETITRFRELLARALTPVKRRKATRPSKASKEKRLSEKRRHSERKARRRQPGRDE